MTPSFDKGTSFYQTFFAGYKYVHSIEHTVHKSRVDSRKECESCGNGRFREWK
jgi:hypothetical protein